MAIKIKFKRKQRKRIRKFLSGFHCKERVDLYEVFTANVHDSKGAANLLDDMRIYYPSVSLVKADKEHAGVDSGLDGCVVECVKSNFGTAEFRPLSGRWVVERTNAWLENYRRLCRNYERYLSSARAMTYFAAILFMLRHC